MLQARSAKPVAAVETSLIQSAQKRGVNVLSIIHLGRLLQGAGSGPERDASVFTLCRPDLSAALLAAEMRMASFIPCRVAVFEQEGGVSLEAFPPSEICRMLGRPDLETLAAPLEVLLREIMDEAARGSGAGQPCLEARGYAPGATEGMVNSRAAIPQRIDCHGTKVEEIAGTGRHDAPGG